MSPGDRVEGEKRGFAGVVDGARERQTVPRSTASRRSRIGHYSTINC